jgi:hypothetical protein
MCPPVSPADYFTGSNSLIGAGSAGFCSRLEGREGLGGTSGDGEAGTGCLIGTTVYRLTGLPISI